MNVWFNLARYPIAKRLYLFTSANGSGSDEPLVKAKILLNAFFSPQAVTIYTAKASGTWHLLWRGFCFWWTSGIAFCSNWYRPVGCQIDQMMPPPTPPESERPARERRAPCRRTGASFYRRIRCTGASAGFGASRPVPAVAASVRAPAAASCLWCAVSSLLTSSRTRCASPASALHCSRLGIKEWIETIQTIKLFLVLKCT